VIGSGPDGLSCAYYLALTGRTIDVYGKEAQPGGQLLQIAARGDLPQEALNRDLQGVLANNIHFNGQQKPGETFDIAELRHSHCALYITAEFAEILNDALVSLCGPNWREALDPMTRQVMSQPGLYVGENLPMVVEAVAEGRRVAVSIGKNGD
jgi:NADPH-dependent glutamate synthase beta subunit-like oxidoreductase